MYLVPIVVPIYVDGTRRFVTTEWKRSLELLRDSLQGRYGEITVLAPRETLDRNRTEQEFEEVDRDADGVHLVPSIPSECRARDYWLTHRRRWRADAAALMERAEVVHTSVDDLYRPRMYDAWKLAVARGLPTVLVQDTDVVLQIRDLTAGASRRQRVKWACYCFLYERACRRAVKRSSLSLLKGESLMRRYARFGRRVREFHDTSYLSGEIVPLETIRERLAGLEGPRPLRFVYCGRLVPRKGVPEGIAIVEEARKRGARIEFDIIGDGPQGDDVRRLIDGRGLGQAVRALGRMPYDRGLIRKLSAYDAMFFTPLGEDTPRMIFDGYAAGLPLVATGIEYVLERARAERASLVLPRNDVGGAADLLVRADSHRRELAELALRASEAGRYHAADTWYARRAEWTFEAVSEARAGGRG